MKLGQWSTWVYLTLVSIALVALFTWLLTWSIRIEGVGKTLVAVVGSLFFGAFVLLLIWLADKWDKRRRLRLKDYGLNFVDNLKEGTYQITSLAKDGDYYLAWLYSPEEDKEGDMFPVGFIFGEEIVTDQVLVEANEKEKLVLVRDKQGGLGVYLRIHQNNWSQFANDKNMVEDQRAL